MDEMKITATPVYAPETRERHERRCWDCGNVAKHADAVVPAVLCTRCGSQDTRRTKKSAVAYLVRIPAEHIIGQQYTCLTNGRPLLYGRSSPERW